MPALPVVPGVIRVALVGKLDNDTDVVNRFYLNYFSSGSPPASLNTLCTNIGTDWSTDLLGMYGSHFTMTNIDAEDLSTPSSAVGAATVAHTGTRTGGIVSASACALLQFHISRRYRGGHPRMYTPCLTQTDLTDEQKWNPASLAALVSAWTTFFGHARGRVDTAYSTSGTDHSNVSFYEGFTNETTLQGRNYSRAKVRTGAIPIDNINSYTANPNVASQRRRNQTP